MPSEALVELEQAPFGLVESVMDMRSYVRTKEEIDRASKDKPLPQTAMARMVYENYRDRLRELRDGRRT